MVLLLARAVEDVCLLGIKVVNDLSLTTQLLKCPPRPRLPLQKTTVSTVLNLMLTWVSVCQMIKYMKNREICSKVISVKLFCIERVYECIVLFFFDSLLFLQINFHAYFRFSASCFVCENKSLILKRMGVLYSNIYSMALITL